MKNKRVIIVVILGMGALISLIYGIVAPTKSGKTAPPTSVVRPRSPQEALSANEVALPPGRVIPSKRHAAKTNFNFWGRNPFAPEQAPVEAAAKLVLNGIMWDEKRPLAIIDNEVVGIGSKIGEHTVKDIKKDSVTLNDGANDLELRLAQ